MLGQLKVEVAALRPRLAAVLGDLDARDGAAAPPVKQYPVTLTGPFRATEKLCGSNMTELMLSSVTVYSGSVKCSLYSSVPGRIVAGRNL